MKKIPLTKGKFALVDDEDYDFLMQWKWFADSQDYAARNGIPLGSKKKTTIRMHRVINKTQKGLDTDHIDGNKLNNQKNNLRTATHSQNLMNVSPRTGRKSSRFKGVSFSFEMKKWCAYINVNSKREILGYFCFEEKAAIAYNDAAIRLHGDFAFLNKV